MQWLARDPAQEAPSSRRSSCSSSWCSASPATPSSASTSSPTSTVPVRRHHDACSTAPRRRRSRPTSPTRSKARSTPSAASTSSARRRARASRQVVIALRRWRRTPTSRPRRCATRSTSSCPSLPEGHRSADRQQGRPRRVPGPARRRASEQPIREAQRDRRQAGSPADREHRRRRPGQRRSAAQSRQINVWLDPIALRARRAHRGRGAARDRGAEPRRRRAAASRPAPRTSRCASIGRVESPEALGRIVASASSDGHAVRLADVARVEDGRARRRPCAAARRASAPSSSSIVKQSGQNTVAVVDAVKTRLDEVQKIAAGRDEARGRARQLAASIRTGIAAVKRAPRPRRRVLRRVVVLVFLGNARSTHHRRARDPDLDRRHVRGRCGSPASRSTSSRCSRSRSPWASSSTTPSSCSRTSSATSTRRARSRSRPPCSATKRDRPRGARDHAVAHGGLPPASRSCPGIVGPLPQELRPHDGVRDRRVAPRELLAHADRSPRGWLTGHARRARRAGEARRSSSALVDAFYRPIERAYMAVLRWVDEASLGDRRRLRRSRSARAGPSRRRLPARLPPEDDTGPVPDQRARARRAPASPSTRLIAERIAGDIAPAPGRHADAPDRGRGRAADRERRQGLRACSSTRAARGLGRSRSCSGCATEILAKLPKELRVTAGEVRRSSSGGQSSAQDPGTRSGARPRRSSAEYATRITEELRKVPGAVDVDNSADRGQARAARGHRSRSRRGSSASRWPTWPARSSSSSAASRSRPTAKAASSTTSASAPTRSTAPTPRALALLDGALVRSYGAVPLTSVVESEQPDAGPSQIERLSRAPADHDHAPNAGPGVGDAPCRRRSSRSSPSSGPARGLHRAAGGRSKEHGEHGRELRSWSSAWPFVFMYLILAAQFESWLHPITILLSLPLTVPFALLSLILFDQSLEHLLGARPPRALRRGEEERDPPDRSHEPPARSRACRGSRPSWRRTSDRLRPILMTTIAFVAGMIPLVVLAAASGSGTEPHDGRRSCIGGQTPVAASSRCWRRPSPTRSSTTRG